MMQAVAASAAGLSGASAIHMNIFGLNPVVVYGSDDQKRRMLPPIAAGKAKACFAVTEADAGLETAKIKTRAERRGDRKSTRLNSSHVEISYAVFCLKKKINYGNRKY